MNKIDVINECIRANPPFESTLHDCISDCMDKWADQQTATLQQELDRLKNPWVKCSERLPRNNLKDKNGEIYVLASEDEDVLTVEKVFYNNINNTYWIPFTGQQYYPKWWCELPEPPQQ